MNERIEDNPSFSKMKKDMEGFNAIKKVYKFLRLFGLKSKSLDEAFSKFPDLKNQFKELSETPDKFNKYFSEKGWIAHESMNHDLMKDAIALAEQNKSHEAEKLLIAHYQNENTIYLLSGLKVLEEAKHRYSLIYAAFQDYMAQRYHACVPVFLMMIDGIANDIIKKNKGFFAEDNEIAAFDTIAGHHTGLDYIAKIFRQSRKKTTTEDITLPFRNGILHGRDLGYANEIVATKVLVTLIALKDWGLEFKKGKSENDFITEKKSFSEHLSDLKGTIEQYAEIKKEREKINIWKPRLIKIGETLPSKGKIEDYKTNTPEKQLISFFTHWRNRKYGKIVEMLSAYKLKGKNKNQLAGEIRKIFINVELQDYEMIAITDTAAAATNITVSLKIKSHENIASKIYEFRLINEDDTGKPFVLGDKRGRWRIMDTHFYDFEYAYLTNKND